MDLQEKKEIVKKLIDETESEHLLIAIQQLIDFDKTTKGNPITLTKEDIIRRALISELDIENGRTINLRELTEKMKKW